MRNRTTRAGATLLELVIVVTVVGIVAAYALQRFDAARERAYQAAMMNDLRNIASHQEDLFEAQNGFAGEPADLASLPLSPDVRVLSVASGGDRWAVSVGHDKTGTECSLSMGEGQDNRIQCANDQVDFSASTTSPETGEAVTFDAGFAIAEMAYLQDRGFGFVEPLYAADPADIAEIEWDFGDGTLDAGDPLTHKVVQHAFTGGDRDYMVRLRLTRHDGRTAFGVKRVRVVNGVILSAAPEIEFIRADGGLGKEVTFFAEGDLPEGTLVEWDLDGEPASGTEATRVFDTPGQYRITVRATDKKGRSFERERVIEIDDLRAPMLDIEIGEILWPPNHKFRHVDLTAHAIDDFDTTPTIVAIAYANEVDEGGGDGSFAGDIRVTKPDGTVLQTSETVRQVEFDPFEDMLELRAERSGTGDGRVYTIEFRAGDAAGNQISQPIGIYVPHDMADDPDYEGVHVNGSDGG